MKPIERHILIAEDNSMNVLVARKLLKDMNVVLHVAINGQQAVDMIKAGRIKFDIILMDIHMPILNGYKASVAIRKFGITIPIIALTASALDEIEGSLEEFGITDFLPKPLEPDSFTAVIKRYLPTA